MKPSKEIIEKFQKIYFEEFGEEISKEEAYDKFLRTVNLLRTILKTSSKKDQDVETPGPSLFDEHFKNAKLEE
jgi:dsDNA-binding SOS-regulon protein